MVHMWRPTFPGALVPPDFLFNSTVYHKGAWILHMLRGIVGDDDFFKSINFYTDRHRYGNAVTDDLVHAFEEITGDDFDWFFDRWIYGEGRPAYALSWTVDCERDDPVLDMTIEQIQETPLFRMPIQIGIADADGDYLIVVDDSLLTQNFRIPVRLPPISVELDPNEWILRQTIGTDVPETPPIRIVLGNPWPSPGVPPFRIPVSPLLGSSRIEVLDLTGRRIRSIAIEDRATLIWDGRDEGGRDLPSGLYFVRAGATNGSQSRRIWIVR